MVTLRLIVPPERTDVIARTLDGDDRTTNILVLRGCAVRPAGDLVQCEVTREAATDVLGWLRAQGIYDDGSVVITEVAAAPSTNARATERAAPGAPDDAIVWDAVLDNAYGEVRGSWSFYAFLTLAITIASVAVVTDSSILVVGAMVVGPEFGVVAALALGLAAGRPGLIKASIWQLLKGFAFAIAITAILALLARAVGWIEIADVTGPRPLTGFILATRQMVGRRRSAGRHCGCSVSDSRPLQRPGRRLHLRDYRASRRRLRFVVGFGRLRAACRFRSPAGHQPARHDACRGVRASHATSPLEAHQDTQARPASKKLMTGNLGRHRRHRTRGRR